MHYGNMPVLRNYRSYDNKPDLQTAFLITEILVDIGFVVVAAVVAENEAFLIDAQLTDSAIISDGGKVHRVRVF